jgi:3-hydroxymyristoyl/3-hydroxydecanoyl-(acyl carrier protein) dehydratase
MNASTLKFPSGTLFQLMSESAQRSSSLHQQFLQVRRDSLQNMRALIEMQMRGGISSPNQPTVQRPALFDSHQLDEFGVGRISNCFGPDFADYDLRRIPRIPNGDLKMMSRITEISGDRNDLRKPAAITVEYDVPVDAWYLRDNASQDIPASLWMEIALQPCGFLSAYLDTYAHVPYESFNFRNLDGSTRVLAQVDVRGKTITTHARMLTSVVSGGTVIQKFAFELSCAGQPVYEGESTFGYFSIETMANQAGLDGGKSVLPDLRGDAAFARSAVRLDTHPLRVAHPARPFYHLSQGQLSFLDEVSLVRDGGLYGRGYIYASRPINPQDWFYPYHFYQDPVMPGSLGIEAILEAVKAYALAYQLDAGMRSPRFQVADNTPPMTWRYRGQITQQHKQMELEVHLKSIDPHPGGLILLADASLWVDELRIYEIKNAAVAILEE